MASPCNEQGPTISPVYCTQNGKVSIDYYAIVICVPKKALYESVKQLRAVSNPCSFLLTNLTFQISVYTVRSLGSLVIDHQCYCRLEAAGY